MSEAQPRLDEARPNLEKVAERFVDTDRIKALPIETANIIAELLAALRVERERAERLERLCICADLPAVSDLQADRDRAVEALELAQALVNKALADLAVLAEQEKPTR